MNKFTGVLTIFLLVAIVVVGFIESLPAPIVQERPLTSKTQHMMRVAMIGNFRTVTNPDSSTTAEKSVFVVNAKGAMHVVSNYGPDFKGELKEGDRVYVTLARVSNYMDKEQIVGVTINYLITEEDEANAE